MKLTYFNILGATLGLLCISSCSDDMHDEYLDNTPLSFAVSSSWGEGKTISTRAAYSDILLNSTSDIDISYENYPQQIVVQVDRDGKNLLEPFLISKLNAKTECENHSDYYLYDAQGSNTHFYVDHMGDNYDFYAWTTLDSEPGSEVSTTVSNPKLWKNVPAFGFCDYLYCRKAPIDIIKDGDKKSGHILFDLKHYTAMLRLFYGYDSKYAKVRNIVLRQVKINSLNGTKKENTLDLAKKARFTTIDGAPGFLLSTASKAFGYLYVNPDNDKIQVSTRLSLECTYDIYDDEAFDSDGKPIADDISAHRTRKNVTAVSSAFTLKSASITKLESGKYYDLSVTINPDYLYVLSEHDEKAVTVK